MEKYKDLSKEELIQFIKFLREENNKLGKANEALSDKLLHIMMNKDNNLSRINSLPNNTLCDAKNFNECKNIHKDCFCCHLKQNY